MRSTIVFAIFAPMNYPDYIYIKLPIYVQQFLRQRYSKEGADGTGPVYLNHQLHPAGVLLYRKVDSNANLEPWTTLSLSAQAYELCDLVNTTSPDTLPLELKGLTKVLPATENKRFYLPLAITHEHMFAGRLIPSDKTAQLHHSDAQELRSIIFEEFWEDFDNFLHEWMEHPELHKGEETNEQAAMQAYMISRDIDLDNEDALGRVFRRRKHNNKIIIKEC